VIPAETAARCAACEGMMRLLGPRDGYDYFECLDCGAVQLHPFPSAELLKTLYEEQYVHAGHYGDDAERHNRIRRQVFNWLADRITKLCSAEEPVMEIGAGWGGLAEILLSRGIAYEGWELSADAVAAARERGLPIRFGTIEDAREAGAQATVVVSCAVYEHLSNQLEFLISAKEILQPGGYLVLQCPSAGLPARVSRWLSRILPHRDLPSVFGSLAPPWHVLLPTPASVRAQASQAGLAVVEVCPSPSGRAGGLRSALQVLNEVIGRTGFSVRGESWPYVMAHVYILQRV